MNAADKQQKAKPSMPTFSSMQQEKQKLRRLFKKRRDDFFLKQPALHAKLSLEISRRILDFIYQNKATKICCSMVTQSEVNTSLIIETLLAHQAQKNFRVFLPAMRKEQGQGHGRSLVARELTSKQSLAQQLITDPLYSIKEPNPAFCKSYYGDIHIILTPGLLFDETGNRIGFGKGYYDSFLLQHGESLSLGVFFELQRFPDLSPFMDERYDRKVFQVFSEKNNLA